MSSNPKYFAVVSWGCAGTVWLAKALNSHLEVFCAHAANHDWAAYADARKLSGIEYLHLLNKMACDSYLAVGDVHGFERGDIPRIRTKFGDRFSCAVLVREPIARLTSQIGLFQQLEYGAWGDLKYVDELAESAGIDPRRLTISERHFIHGANMLNAIVEEKQCGQIYRMEDVTTDPYHLIELLADITGGNVSLKPIWAEEAINSRVVNSHPNANFKFGSFERQVLQKIVCSAAWDIYSQLGYPEANY